MIDSLFLHQTAVQDPPHAQHRTDKIRPIWGDQKYVQYYVCLGY